MNSDQTVEQWREILESRTAQHRLIDQHSLHLYYGADAAGQAMFFLVTDLQPRPPAVSGALSIEVRRRKDDKWVAVLTLIDNELEEAFMGMCVELARRTQDAQSEKDGVGLFDATLKQWQSMLSALTLRSLSREQQRGLFAELAFGLKLAESTSPREMVFAWDGPLGSAQDFRHPALGIFEVKAVGQDAGAVRVSSPAQLDPEPSEKVDLVVMRIVDDQLGAHADSQSLLDLVQLVRSSIQGHPDAIDALDARLGALGFDRSDARYAESQFRVIERRIYRTNEGFPRLRSTSVPVGVERVKYQIQLSSLLPFEISFEHALNPSRRAVTE